MIQDEIREGIKGIGREWFQLGGLAYQTMPNERSFEGDILTYLDSQGVVIKKEGINTAWLIESGDYEQRGVDGIATSYKSAVELITNRYRNPYIVEWSDNDGYLLGNFECVPNYSTKHTAQFDITEIPIEGNDTLTEPLIKENNESNV